MLPRAKVLPLGFLPAAIQLRAWGRASHLMVAAFLKLQEVSLKILELKALTGLEARNEEACKDTQQQSILQQ
jgi:hypothetical protein